MPKKFNKQSPKKAGSNSNQVHELSSESDSDKRVKKGAKQGKLNPKKPFAKVDHYSTEESSDSEDTTNPPVSSHSQGRSSSKPVLANLESTQYNMLLACIKNKAILVGVDFIEIMARKQGANGSKGLKGNDLKRYLSWKEIKLILSKLALCGANFQSMEIFLTSVKVHLVGNNSYQEIASDIVAKICHILESVCFMENVDNGVFSDYFNRRVADLRNRRNYEMK